MNNFHKVLSVMYTCLIPWALFAAWTIASWSLWQWQWMKTACGAFFFSRAWTPVFFPTNVAAPSKPMPTSLQHCTFIFLSQSGNAELIDSVLPSSKGNSHKICSTWSIFHPTTKKVRALLQLQYPLSWRWSNMKLTYLQLINPYSDCLHEIDDSMWCGVGCILCYSTNKLFQIISSTRNDKVDQLMEVCHVRNGMSA